MQKFSYLMQRRTVVHFAFEIQSRLLAGSDGHLLGSYGCNDTSYELHRIFGILSLSIFYLNFEFKLRNLPMAKTHQ
jgi:hypothetical protein